MNIFITGATGYIGSRLALRLAVEGHTIHAMYRDDSKATILNHPNIKLFRGDILDRKSLGTAIAGCEQVYHTAAFAKVWDREPSRIYRLNVEGTMNVITAGIEAGVKKFVCTSTAGVFGPAVNSSAIDETCPLPQTYFTDYEASKAIAEKSLHTLCLSGLNIVIVNPSRVYGPGLLSESNGVTRMIKSYVEGHWRMIPGNGKSPGNYVHVEDVVTGHILAMQYGLKGENYILGDCNISYNQLFEKLNNILSVKRTMIHIPLGVMMFLSGLMLLIAKISGKPPLITPPLVKKFNHKWIVSSDKAISELGYKPMGIDAGLQNTVNWILEQKTLKL